MNPRSQNKYLVQRKVALCLLCCAVFMSCAKRKPEVDNIYDDLADPPRKTKIEPVAIFPPIDTVRANRIGSFRDSLYLRRKDFMLIVQEQSDGECYGTDSSFYSEFGNPIIRIGLSGCLAEVHSTLDIYDSTGLIYFHDYAEDDGLIFEKRTVFLNGLSTFGFHTDFKWESDRRSLVDSSLRMLSKKELEDEISSQQRYTDRALDALHLLRQIRPKLQEGHVYKFSDTIQKIVEQSYYLMDSAQYVNWLTKSSITK